MKRISILSAFLLLSAFSFAQVKNLQATFAYCTFHIPGSDSYVESYLSVASQSVQFVKNNEGKYHAAIEVFFNYKNGQNVVFSDAYTLISPVVDNPSDNNFVFLDQQRVSLPAGTYSFELTIRDKNSSDKAYNIEQDLVLDYDNETPSISRLQFIESYEKAESTGRLTKNGYDLVPYVQNFYPKSINKLTFYCEVYNTAKALSNDPFIISYFIESADSRKKLDNLAVFKKSQSKDVVPLLSEFNIESLPSGNYNLVVEVRSKTNDLLALRSEFFQRSNIIATPSIDEFSTENVDMTSFDISNTFASTYKDKEELKDHINSLRPIANTNEQIFIDNQLKRSELEMMQKFFYSFWARRNVADPSGQWALYAKEVEKVNKVYSSSIRRGYETDRGRVYLQYGAPNFMSENTNEPSAYPYEIWHYYKVDNQTNKKFVFYNPDLVTNDFILLHSDVIGEINNQNWNAELFKRSQQSRDFDEKSGSDHMGSKSEDFFKSPH
ncbi:MAG TPA: GWxTD domain-containing protein [Bacteroidia bacterium]|nr:GWxTD domain-containing protein [Bacteroidia bacterium]HNT80388.1 GWxTD domain-containing protein [Bacteroidia bacterium]